MCIEIVCPYYCFPHGLYIFGENIILINLYLLDEVGFLYIFMIY